MALGGVGAVTQAKGAFAMSAMALGGPAGGIAGAIAGGVLGARRRS